LNEYAKATSSIVSKVPNATCSVPGESETLEVAKVTLAKSSSNIAVAEKTSSKPSKVFPFADRYVTAEEKTMQVTASTNGNNPIGESARNDITKAAVIARGIIVCRRAGSMSILIARNT
jgi:hypothetical protein